MSFHVVLPNYQVETQDGFQSYPNHREAEKEYQNLVLENIPCELYREGILQKEYKPLTS